VFLCSRRSLMMAKLSTGMGISSNEEECIDDYGAALQLYHDSCRLLSYLAR
jgi:hypothetical protein